jgi:DNA repair exonuclease SbcCD nuclease subunit
MNVFNKAAIFTDIHFGEKLDSEQHNSDCLEFVEWFCDNTRKNDCDIVIFMGDWYHNRVRTENRTADYSRRALEMLDKLDRPIYWILGNHEIYLKNSRDIHSLHHLPRYNNFILIDEIIQIEDVVFSPWLVGAEQDDLLNRRCKYIFGHFELPFFLMNQVIEKRWDGEGLHIDDFVKCEAVYSGHFHKRQVRLNKHKIPIYYIGNCFGHNFNDVNDPERGMAILSYGETLPEYIQWPHAPTYHRMQVSQFLELLEKDQPPGNRSYLELVDDVDLDDDSAGDLKNSIEARHIKIIPKETKWVINEGEAGDQKYYASIDQMIESQLRSLNYDGKFRPDLLIDLYRQA